MLLNIKKALENDSKKGLSSIETLFYDFLKEEKSQEEVLEELEDTDLTQEDLQNLLDDTTEDLVTQLVINQVNPDLAYWLFNQNISDFNKEEIAYASLQEDLMEDSSKLLVDLYIQDFLNSKEKSLVLKKINQQGLLQLALHFKEGEEFNKFLPFMDDLTLSSLAQHHLINPIPKNLVDLLINKNLVINANALALYSKSDINKDEDLIEKALESADAEIVYFFLNKDVGSKSVRELILGHFIQGPYWGRLSQLDLKISNEIKEYLVQKENFEVKKNKDEKTLEFKGVILATLKDQKVTYEAYYSKEAEIIINKFLNNSTTLPEVIEGTYNFYLDKFSPRNKSLDVLGLDFDLQEDNSLEYAKLKKWKPNVEVPARLENKKQSVVTIIPESLEFSLWQSSSVKELQEKFKQKIQSLISQLKPIPMNPARPFGVEVELCLVDTTPDDLATEIEGDNEYDDSTSGTPTSQVKRVSKNWVVKWDGSVKHLDDKGKPLTIDKVLNQNRYTAEITTPKLYGEDGLVELKDKLETVFNIGPDKILINSSCGLHVHHDISELFNEDDKMDEKIQLQVQDELYKLQDSLYDLCSSDRRNNHYCPRMTFKKSKVEQPVIDVFYDENNRLNTPRPGFNFNTGYGTIEFRMHEATLSSEQIVNWVRITHQIVEGVIRKVTLEKEKSTMILLETLKLMEIEKLKKLNTETDLETALKEINDFVRSQAWSQALIKTSN